MKQATPFFAISKCYAYVLKQLGFRKETTTTAPKNSIATLIEIEPRKPILRTDAALLEESNKMTTEKRQLVFQPKSWKHSDIVAELNRMIGNENPSTALEKRLEEEDRIGTINIQFVRKTK